MCYAFVQPVEEQLAYTRDDVHGFPRYHTHHIRLYRKRSSPTADGGNVKTNLLKRPADSTLEHSRAKVLKRCTDDNSIIDLDPSEGATTEAEETDLTEEVKNLKLRIKNLETENEELKDKNEDLTYDKSELQVKQDNRVELLKTEQNKIRTLGKQTIQRIKDDIRADIKRSYDQKLDKVKLNHKHKMDDLKVKHEDETDELKNDISRLEKEVKDAKTGYAKAEKEFKMEHQKALKEAKQDFQEQLKQHKPEHSKAVKEKESVVQEKQKAITELEKARDELKQEIQKMKSFSKRGELDKAKIQAEATEKDTHIEKLQEALREQYERMEKETAAKKKMAEEFKRERDLASQRWQLENKKAEKYAHDFIGERRSAGSLRDSLNRSTARIEELEGGLKKARAMCERLKMQTADGS